MNGTLVLHPRLTAALACLVLAFVALTPASLAADVADVGFIDQAALSNLAPFANANRKLTAIKADLDGQFQARLRGVKSANDQARIAQEFQNKFGAIASVASSKNLSVVVDKRIIIFGGTDVTHDVIDLFSGVGDPVPPSSTPPPSSVGYVDEQQINAVPKIKKANDDFAKIQDDQRNAAQAKMRGAKSDADRQQIFKDLQKTLLEKHKEIVDPVVDQTRNAIADVARRKGLALVIDRGDLIYGGTDITTDVTNALK